MGLGPAAANLDSEHKEVARGERASSGSVSRRLCRVAFLKGGAGLTVGSWPRLAGASDKADAGGVDSRQQAEPHAVLTPARMLKTRRSLTQDRVQANLTSPSGFVRLLARSRATLTAHPCA